MQFATLLSVFLASLAAATPLNNALEQRNEALEQRQAAAGVVTYISYEALKRNTIPCSHRGDSYKNCYAGGAPGGQANEWTRGCSVITRCARSL